MLATDWPSPPNHANPMNEKNLLHRLYGRLRPVNAALVAGLSTSLVASCGASVKSQIDARSAACANQAADDRISCLRSHPVDGEPMTCAFYMGGWHGDVWVTPNDIEAGRFDHSVVGDPWLDPKNRSLQCEVELLAKKHSDRSTDSTPDEAQRRIADEGAERARQQQKQKAEDELFDARLRGLRKHLEDTLDSVEKDCAAKWTPVSRTCEPSTFADDATTIQAAAAAGVIRKNEYGRYYILQNDYSVQAVTAALQKTCADTCSSAVDESVTLAFSNAFGACLDDTWPSGLKRCEVQAPPGATIDPKDVRRRRDDCKTSCKGAFEDAARDASKRPSRPRPSSPPQGSRADCMQGCRNTFAGLPNSGDLVQDCIANNCR